jgi:hypothetical protein
LYDTNIACGTVNSCKIWLIAVKTSGDLSIFSLRPFHGFGRRNHDLVAAFRTNIGFATGAAKTVAA